MLMLKRLVCVALLQAPLLWSPPSLADNDADEVALTCAEGPSDKRATVIIEDCDSGVKNQVIDQCTIADLLRVCQPKPVDERARCYAKTTNALKEKGLISGKEKGDMQLCAADDRKAEGEKPGKGD